ncbi:methyl-accepting chemotaxis protein [Aliivibrio fischeri ES114]|uniref:Methyl-accepting chemotaxis protein n=2 Tax=Aliivibrio fischeri TaxID=668 RepID=Q5DYJ2_ALIF1|nr:methyl-accepting chemotaxis protein [Aliivibrio fischeri ES114]KLU80629.1 hypothetical protein AB192_02050 [Aliivibrio fischeri]
MQLKNKIIFSFTLLIFIIMSLTSLYSWINFKKYSEDQFLNKTKIESNLLVTILDEEINGFLNLLRTYNIDLSKSIPIQSISSQIKIRKSNKNIQDSYIALSDGTVYRESGEFLNFNASNREWFKSIIIDENKTAISNVYIDEVTKEPVITLSIPIKTSEKIEAVAAIDVKVNTINNILNLHTDKRNQYYLISNSTGNIIASGHKNDIGKDANKLIPELLPKGNLTTSTIEVVKDNKKITATYNKLNNADWTLILYEYNEQISENSTSNLLKTTIMFLTLLTISVIAIYYFVIKNIYLPIGGDPSEISKIMKSMSNGNLNIKIENENNSGIFLSMLNLSEELKKITNATNNITKKVSSSSTELSSVMSIAASNAQIELEQIEQITTAISELSSTASEVNNNAVSTDNVISETIDRIEQGNLSLEKSNNISNEINHSILNTGKIISELREFSTEIGSIIDVIKIISEQINLLALNAAIEAARAGEQGRGFAVVADEVRNLAGKTQKSTENIQEIITKLQTHTEKADISMRHNVELIEDSSNISLEMRNCFQEITLLVNQISDMNSLVSTASQEQSNVTEEVAKSVIHTFDLVNQNVTGINQSNSASEELAKLSEEQKNILSFFKLK